MTAASLPDSGNRRSQRIGRVWLAGLIVAAATAFIVPQATYAAANDPIDGDETPPTSNYVPTTTIGDDRSLDVSAFSPVCISDAPFIRYAIKPIGFTSSGPATLTFYDLDGNFVEQQVVQTLSGHVVYPGASVDAKGKPTDWPGWKQAPNGDWIPDDSDAFLRDGLTIEVEVNPTATAAVSYPPATSSCFGPPETIPPTPICVDTSSTGGSDATTTGDDPCDPCVPGTATSGDPECDPCVPGTATSGSASSATGDPECYPCTPGQTTGSSSTTSGTSAANCTLPRTGSDGVQKILIAGAIALTAGIGVAFVARRRKSGAAPI
jgi:LPXTG-motif cell wall-anchored protein